MRAIVVRPGPNFSVEDVATGWAEGLAANGVEVQEFDLSAAITYHERALQLIMGRDVDRDTASRMAAAVLRQRCFDFWPDIVIIVSAFFIPPDTFDLIRSRGIKLVTLLTECPYEDDNQAKIAKRSDLAIVNDPTNLDRYPDNTFYLPAAYRPQVHCPGPFEPDEKSDFAFVGTAFPSRIEFLEQVDWTGIDVALAGNWHALQGTASPLTKYVAHDLDACCANEASVQLYRGTKASVNLYRREAQRPELIDGWSMSPREVELAATGCFFLTERRGENAQALPMVPTFDSPQHFETQLRWFLAHDNAREEITQAARDAISDRTFTNHAAMLLNHLETRRAGRQPHPRSDSWHASPARTASSTST